MNTMKHDEELLSQYLDGELSAPESLQLEQRLAAEPELRSVLEKMQAINVTLQNTFNTARSRTVPGRIIQMLNTSRSRAPVLTLGTRAHRSGWGFALAASIMAASGLLLLQGTGQADRPVADVLLAQVLDKAPSRGEGWEMLADGRQVRPVLSYARTGGGWCREYLLSDQTGIWHGVSCLDQGRWVTEVLGAQSPAGSTNEYRTASATDTNQIAIFMEEHAADIALSAEREEELIATGWR